MLPSFSATLNLHPPAAAASAAAATENSFKSNKLYVKVINMKVPASTPRRPNNRPARPHHAEREISFFLLSPLLPPPRILLLRLLLLLLLFYFFLLFLFLLAPMRACLVSANPKPSNHPFVRWFCHHHQRYIYIQSHPPRRRRSICAFGWQVRLCGLAILCFTSLTRNMSVE